MPFHDKRLPITYQGRTGLNEYFNNNLMLVPIMKEVFCSKTSTTYIDFILVLTKNGVP